MEEELVFLRTKVDKLEALILNLQEELNGKLRYVLKSFLDHRAEQVAKRKRALQLEEDTCLNLASFCEEDTPKSSSSSKKPSPSVKLSNLKPTSGGKRNQISQFKGLKATRSEESFELTRQYQPRKTKVQRFIQDVTYCDEEDQDLTDSSDINEDEDEFASSSAIHLPSSIPATVLFSEDDFEDVHVKTEMDESNCDDGEDEIYDEHMFLDDATGGVESNYDLFTNAAEGIRVAKIGRVADAVTTMSEAAGCSKNLRKAFTTTSPKKSHADSVWSNFNYNQSDKRKGWCSCKNCGLNYSSPRVERLRKHIQVCPKRINFAASTTTSSLDDKCFIQF